jgi:hypothetical protein
MKLGFWDLFLGIASIVGVVSGFKFEDPTLRVLLIIGSLILLLVVYLSTNMNEIKAVSEMSQKEINRLNEKIRIHEILANHDVRIKNLEERGRR